MIFDLGGPERSALDKAFDVCIAGSGPAGITLARLLARQGLDVAILEAGELDFTSRSQDFYRGDNVGLDYHDLDVTRLRYFGGTSNHWGGRSRGLEAHDFDAHPFHPLSGWPITKGDLDPYVAATDEILDLSAVTRNRPAELSSDLERIYFRRSPTRFADKYLEEIRQSERISLFLNANLVDLQLDESLATAMAATVKSYEAGDPGTPVAARCYCLCMGGLENPRFLLNATGQIPAGIGNQHDLVGRFFAEHLALRLGDVLFEGDVPPSADYTPTPGMMREHEVLNFNLLLSTQGHELPREVARSAICISSFTERLAAEVLGWSVNCGTGGVRAYLSARWSDDYDKGRLNIIIEQALNRESRVTLTPDRDEFGLRRIALDWRLADLDFRTMRTVGLVLGEQLAERGIGRVQVSEWLLDDRPTPPEASISGLHHHMCTTRMSDDPRQGVVDRDCRVHGMSNLYLGGSSVFATAGQANPTYTIVQLALRLADHLADRLA